MKRSNKQIEKRIKEYHPFTCPRCDCDATLHELNYNFSEDEFTNTYECPVCGLVWTNVYHWGHTELEEVKE